eukprot:2050279-Pyramimonas_sp.AAC.1
MLQEARQHSGEGRWTHEVNYVVSHALPSLRAASKGDDQDPRLPSFSAPLGRTSGGTLRTSGETGHRARAVDDSERSSKKTLSLGPALQR